VNGATAIDLIGHDRLRDASLPSTTPAAVAEWLESPSSKLYNPLETAVMLGKAWPPRLQTPQPRPDRRERIATYRFKGRNYMRALVAVLLAKRLATFARPEIHPDHLTSGPAITSRAPFIQQVLLPAPALPRAT
jgi:hypothetical protein